jgi:hypothetical protein
LGLPKLLAPSNLNILRFQTLESGCKMQPAEVPFIAPLRRILDTVQPYFLVVAPQLARGGPIDLTNVADRMIKLSEGGFAMAGVACLSEGLANNLKELGIDDLVIQRIMRHGDVGTTRKSYHQGAQLELRGVRCVNPPSFRGMYGCSPALHPITLINLWPLAAAQSVMLIIPALRRTLPMTDCHKYCDQPEIEPQAPQWMLAVLAQQRRYTEEAGAPYCIDQPAFPCQREPLTEKVAFFCVPVPWRIIQALPSVRPNTLDPSGWDKHYG